MKKTLFLLITAFVFAVCLFACEGEKPDVSQDVSQTFSEAESSTSEASEEESRVYETSVPEISIPEISEPEESIPEEVIEKRLSRAAEEVVYIDEYEYYVVNDDLVECVEFKIYNYIIYNFYM